MKEENWTIEYTYPQLPIQTATTRPGSILNRQGGSIFNRREQSEVPFQDLFTKAQNSERANWRNEYIQQALSRS
jgi:hypothetical protein